MSKLKLQGDAGGTGIFTIASPNSSTDRTITLPDDAGTIITSAQASTSAYSFVIDEDNLASDFNGVVNYTCHEVNKAEEDVWLVYPWETVGEY